MAMHSIKLTDETIKLMNRYKARLLNTDPTITGLTNGKVVNIALRKALKTKVYKQ